MEINRPEQERIKDLLKTNPRGMSVTDIARELKISRNTTAKYLEMLRVSGHVDMESIGTAKVYYLSHRIPVSTLLNFSSDYILVVDSYLNIIQVNRKFLELLNQDKNNVVGQKADRLLFPVLGDVEIAVHLYEAIGGKEHKETIHFSTNGKDCYFYAKIIPSTFDDGGQGATLILENITENISSHNSVVEHRDRLETLVQERTRELEGANRALKKEIAEREKAEELLKESEERYKRLYMESPLGYQVMTKEGILLGVSTEWLHTMGYTEEEVIGRPFKNFLCDKNREDIVNEILWEEQKNTVHSYCEMLKKDGSTIVASFSCNLGQANSGKSDRVQCIMRDVTQHRQIGEEIQKNERMLKTILNSLQNGILVIDSGTYEIIYVNNAGCKILGDSQENILGKKYNDYICDSPFERRPASMKDSRVHISTCILAKSDGKAVPIIRTVNEITIDGKKHYVENFIQDEE